MSEYFGTLTGRPVHPASPVLLTKNGPLRILMIRMPIHPSKMTFHTHLKFENRFRALRPEGL
jgi:hypothetical protein